MKRLTAAAFAAGMMIAALGCSSKPPQASAPDQPTMMPPKDAQGKTIAPNQKGFTATP